MLRLLQAALGDIHVLVDAAQFLLLGQLQCPPQPGGPLSARPQAVRQLLPRLVRAERRILSLIKHARLTNNLSCQPPELLSGQRPLRGGVSGDLGAIDGHHSNLAHPLPSTNGQHLAEQPRQRLGMSSAEPGQRRMIRPLLSGDHHECHI
jgi:hypothetical protein